MNAPNCSICLEEVLDNNARSIAKLKCGHFFHLGSEFNIGGLMRCPNCRDIENGDWLFLEYKEPYEQYEEEDEAILLLEPSMEIRVDPTAEVEAQIAMNIRPTGEPMQVLPQLLPMQNAADVNEPNLELSLASRNGPAAQPNEQAEGINLELSLAHNSTYGENMDLEHSNQAEEHDDEIRRRSNMLQFL